MASDLWAIGCSLFEAAQPPAALRSGESTVSLGEDHHGHGGATAQLQQPGWGGGEDEKPTKNGGKEWLRMVIKCDT